MGKPNRKHRAAKRAAQGDSGYWERLGAPGAPPPTLDEITAAVARAALESAQQGARGKTPRGDSAVAQRCAAQLATLSLDEVPRAADAASTRIVEATFGNGWLPADIHQIAQRRTDAFAVGYLIDRIAAYARPFPPATVDQTWLAQLDELAADIWWSQPTPHLAQWASKHLLTTEEALATVIEALALLLVLPKLELIRPLPGTAPAHPVAHHQVDEKTLGRVRGLLAKAESTSYPEEAEALSAKAQELITKYALDRALLEAATTTLDLPGAHRIWLDTPYTDAKALLIDVVARANRSRAIFASAWGFVTIVGDDADLDAIALLSTSLLVQATRAMIANRETRGDEARMFRKAFLVAYATRIGERLEAATAAAIAESPEPEQLLPVLASHQVAVDNAFDTLFPHSRNRGISIRSAEGWDAGRAAADRAHLH
ncbi:DUF2786 domain-containing protein [Nocardia huaxiensis]|uniref:DUF2786 domain-containing protein n=1 Tax=Nocardia huaxiensis TaxID=2755382 RepID=A0A7D6VBI9_9NOCA|nr:DUF2786 domain-containing protein [Nocardia huaxiensis]QLY28275.1 DUF2786 domain-containing protein [Nocardia huaxiensis]UFS98289.1 DUF2786 domain-containing protein [Nocardia huaxiensis]